MRPPEFSAILDIKYAEIARGVGLRSGGRRVRSTEQYNRYRGKRRGQGSAVLKVIAAILAVVLVVCLVAMVAMGKYIQYTDDGVKLALPWMEQDETAPPSMEIIIED